MKSRPTRSGRVSMSSAGTVVRVFRRGCAALSSFSRMMERTVSAETVTPLRCSAAVTRRYPQNHVRGVELGFDHQGQLPPSDPRGGVGPAEPVVVSGLGHSDQLAHGCDGAVAFFAADELVALAHRRSFAKKAAAFFKNSFSARSSLFSARSLAISADSAAASGSWASASLLLRLVDPGPPRSAEPGRRRRPRTRSCAPSPGSRERPAP